MSGKQLSPFIKLSIDRSYIDISARKVFYGLEKTFKNATDIVDEIATKMDASQDYEPKGLDIEALKTKFLKYCDSLSRNVNSFSTREIHGMCYHIGDIIGFETTNNKISKKRLVFFKELLHYNWRDKYLIPLVRFVLSKWDKMPTYSEFHQFVLKKIHSYRGNRKRLSQIRKYAIYLSLPGPEALVRYLKQNNKTFAYAPEMFGLKKKHLDYKYFQNLCVNYYRTTDDMETGFEDNIKMCGKEASKITLSMIINDFVEKTKSGIDLSDTKEYLRKLAINNIGLPEDNISWALPENQFYAEKVRESRRTLRIWITQQCIDVVFKIMKDEEDRTEFWSKYAGSIEDFWIAGDNDIKKILYGNSELKGIIDKHYIYADGSNASGTSVFAFIMRIKDRTIVEFSKKGNAFYVYEEQYWNDIYYNFKRSQRIRSLKRTSLSRIYYVKNPNNYNDVGKLSHDKLGKWKETMITWFKIKLQVYPDF